MFMRGSRPSDMACWAMEKAPVITAWLAITVTRVARITRGIRPQDGRHQEERIVDVLRMGDDEGALAQIVQHQSREHHAEPGEADGFLAEMAHVGIERFAAGDGQKHAAENQKRKSRLFDQHANAIQRIEGIEYFEIIADVNKAHEADDGKPHGGDGRKNRGDAGGAAILEQEQAEEHGEGERHDYGFKAAD